ncbi:MAG: amidohydrolase family protein [Dehalococcoidia bacterium]|jgi:imidazolonepropionase-like amidohydrolase|nr:amidohydrolase family protein [Dehalococcoidia bacterium]
MPTAFRFVLTIILGAALAATAAAQPSILVVRGATLIDGNGGAPVDDATVVIEGDRIAAIGGVDLPVPDGARVIDGRGRFVVPGLMDMHVHLRGGGSRRDGGAVTTEQERTGIRGLHSYLYAGVTTIYDAGNRSAFIFQLRRKERGGEIVAPRIFATGGTVASPNGHGGPYLVEAWPRDRATLDEHIATGPDILKIGQDEHGWMMRPLINQLPVDLLERIIRHYHEQGIRSTIHVSTERTAWDAIYAGVDTLAHPIIQAPVSDAYIEMMAVRRIPTVSTLTIGQAASRLVEHPEHLDQALYRDTVEPEEIARLRTEQRAREQENGRTSWMRTMTPIAQENLRRLHAVGKDIVVCGTDQFSGPAVHRELELLVEGGIPPADAIVIATRNAARFLGRLDDMGTIEAGKLADLVILDADPTIDVDNLKRIASVIKGGRVVDRSALDLPVNR